GGIGGAPEKRSGGSGIDVSILGDSVSVAAAIADEGASTQVSWAGASVHLSWEGIRSNGPENAAAGSGAAVHGSAAVSYGCGIADAAGASTHGDADGSVL